VKIKLDENLPASLVDGLSTLGHDVDTVKMEHLNGRPDPEIWQAAQRENRFLITQDLDFSDIRRFKPGSHCGLLLVRLTKPGRNALTERIHQLFQTEETEIWRGCFVVATEVKLRIQRPQFD
jgi:predicted nuclease of predicted toxin-antitoxin system